jgi:hypothetical protein
VDVVPANASVWALLATTPVHVFVNTALVESGGVAVKGTTIVSVTTEAVDLDNGPEPVGCPLLCTGVAMARAVGVPCPEPRYGLTGVGEARPREGWGGYCVHLAVA